MVHYSILDRNASPEMPSGPEPAALEIDVQPSEATRMSPSSISAAIAAANEMAAANSGLASSVPSGPRFPGEDGGRSLAAMAQRDLDSALQLLAERAQYITEASGAAIALRRSHHNDMLCRASVGTNAPELGTLLSTESGLSGESVRTRSPLRCDDAERDPRVNRDRCRELGIASVVVIPIVRDEEVLGVFELFSGKAAAFGERDLSALQRLGEMVETAVKLAETARGLPPDVLAEAAEGDAQSVLDPAILEEPVPDGHNDQAETEILATESAPDAELGEMAAPGIPVALPQQVVSHEPAPKPSSSRRPVLWSAPFQTSSEAQTPALADQSHVPPVLRSLQKCWACGFPVSEGRKLCVECEEKQWRGQLRVPAPLAAGKDVPSVGAEVPRVISANQVMAAAAGAAGLPGDLFPSGRVKSEASIPVAVTQVSSQTLTAKAEDTADVESDLPILSGGMEPESWLSANKYMVGALLIVVLVISAVVFLR